MQSRRYSIIVSITGFQIKLIAETVDIIIKSMQSEFSSSFPSSNPARYLPKSDSRRPGTALCDSPSNLSRSQVSKGLRWNIEESKELGTEFSANFSVSNPTANLHLLKPPAPKYGWDSTVPELRKTPSSRSFKTITFSNELEKEYEREKGKQTVEEYRKVRGAANGLATSLGYKVTVTDLLGRVAPAENKEWTPRGEEPERRIKNSKSERKTHYELEKPSNPQSQFNKTQYLFQTPTKSPRKITEERSPTSGAARSYKNIQDQLLRPKADKTASYQSPETGPLERVYPKKHLTVEPTRFYRPIQLAPPSPKSSKSKLSIADFQVGQCKGEGAFGQVFPAIHKATRMLVALKKVSKEKVRFMLEQFVNEIKIQMFLDHPNIVKLYGVFDDTTHFFIVMEYMDGGNLFGLVKKKKKLTEPEAVEKLRQICLGLKEMHDNSILHRDIKPQNIVMTNDVSKLCDFGWAAICKDRRTTYCGTLDYVSPEIIEGQGYDDSVDIWCIGVLAFEMLCGRTPFYNISRKETMKRIKDVHYEYPCEVSPQAKAFIDRILKKNPEERIGIDEVLADKFLNP